MPIKIGSDYEVPKGLSEQREAAEKNNVCIDSFATRNEFHSSQITVAGRSYQRFETWEEKITGIRTIQRNSEQIPGLRCPDCNAQAYKTDHPKVAVCGNYPGWYFFYRRIDQDIRPTTKYVLKNGELVEETEQTKEEASF